MEDIFMTFDEAVKSCSEGNFVSNAKFGPEQSMHEYEHTLYYEDGGNVTQALDFIKGQTWSKDGWYIKFSRDVVNTDKLKSMHVHHNGHSLIGGESYEDCIMKEPSTLNEDYDGGFVPIPTSPHLLTNFKNCQLPLYEEAVRQYGDNDVYIINKAYAIDNTPVKDYSALWVKTFRNMTEFWKLFDGLKREERFCDCK
jgi:hypothetical protein